MVIETAVNTFDPIWDSETSDTMLILLLMFFRCPCNYYNDYKVIKTVTNVMLLFLQDYQGKNVVYATSWSPFLNNVQLLQRVSHTLNFAYFFFAGMCGLSLAVFLKDTMGYKDFHLAHWIFAGML